MSDEQQRGKLSRRKFLLTGAAAAGALGLAACSGGDTSSSGGATTSTAPSASASASGGASASASGSAGASAGGSAAASGGSGWTGNITMFAQQYTPNAREKEPKLQAFRQIADEYQAAHPGITIEFIDLGEAPGYDDTVRTKAAAGEMYDIFWAQWTNLNTTYPEGIAVNLKPYLDQPNPYYTEAPTWREAFNQNILNETADTDGKQYNVNGDFVATAFFYNQALFEQAGITEPPTTWPALLEMANRMQAADITPMAHVPLYGWWQRHFLSDFYSNDYDRITGFDGNPGLSALDQAVAINKGILGPQDPRFMAWWPLFKQFTDTWNQDFLTSPTDDNSTVVFQEFMGGRAAMIYEGSWQPNRIRSADPNFRFGSFSFPTLSKEVSEYSTGTTTSNAVGGPSAGFQYAVSSPRANRTMEEPGKLEAVIDWMRFFARPQQSEQIINEDGSYIPTMVGTEPKAGTELLVEQANAPLRAIQVGGLTDELGSEMQSIFGLYLSGNSTLEEATAEVQELLNAAADAYAAEEGVNFADYQ
jgi:raffinose/stachyose/melibiose transport system substrate-binding protein